MVTKTFQNQSTLALAVVVVLAGQALSGCAQAEAVDAQLHRAPVLTHHARGREPVANSEALLLASDDGIFVSMATKELTPGNAYTLWLVVINEPEACEARPCRPPDILAGSSRTLSDVGYAGGLVADGDGEGHFTAYQAKGPLKQAWYGNGLQDPRGAEIHLVTNDHGPLLAEMVGTMLGSYRGGCSDESLPLLFPDSARADGTPGPNACLLHQMAIFNSEK